MNHIFARSKFILLHNEQENKFNIIEDGFIFSSGSVIEEVGVYSDEKKNHLFNKYGNNIKILGTDNFSLEIPMLKGVILPGFVKAHGHDHESPIIGVARDMPLTPWLDKSVNNFTRFMNTKRNYLENYFNKSPNLIAYMKARLDDIYYGITSSMVHHCNHNKYRVEDLILANTIANTKMIIAIGSQDRNYAKDLLDIPYNIAIDRLNQNYKRFKDYKNVQIIPGPDQVFSNSAELLIYLKKWADEHDTFLHIHSAEEPNTTEWFCQEYGMTEIEYLDSIKILDDRVILAHQVNCLPIDIDLIAKKGAKIVHNPLANTILGSGMPPIIEMKERGIEYVISTDGSGSADNQNILAAARLASQYQKAFHKDATLLSSSEVLSKITIEPAQMLKFNSGMLKAGKDADFILIDLARPNLTPTRADNLIENLIWATDGSEVRYVVSMGEVLKDDYRMVGLDSNSIMSEVQELSEMFIEYSKNYKVNFETGAQNKF